eukprot:TRINITY_DN634_c0_g2_i9.p1 TRINITY_DN634_c0_g2~~TRINITY_DN634_c0_g2_i9.p1  ORF type:complete len:1200 (-),score=227.81 TRINITY_DN634_c0_g2_i9:150-3749(-)
MRSIKHLPKAVYSSLRSSVIFFDITRVVEELVSNSVDAGATKVHVFVNVRACYIKVEDDGYGISRDGLVLLGERYATSKLCCLAEMDVGVESLGFRGEALGSLSDVCLLEVITKARGKPNGYRKVIKGSRCLFLGIDDYRQDVGTTVIVRDLFYNQPVRRKCMQTSPKKVLHSVKKCVLRIALVCPQVSFKVIDIEGEDELFCTLPSVSPLPLVASSFGNGVSSSLRELKFYEGAFKISGYLSGPPDTFSTKVFQFIYVNSRAVSKGPINKLLDSLAAKFECLMTSWRDESESQTAKRQRKQAYLAYMLNICCPHSTYDLTFEPSKTLVEFKDWSPVLSFLEKAIRHFWQESAPPFYKGEFDGHEEDLQGKGKLWKGSNTNVLPLKDPFTLDLSEASGIAKKKSKMQHNQSSAYISPSTGLLEMSSADIDFLSDQHHQSSSRESRTNVIDQEGWHKDHFLRERPVLKQTTEDDGRDAILHLRRNRAFDIDANLSEGSAGVTAICNHFDCKTDAGRVSSLSHGEGALETAIFSNSASMGGILDESTVFSNHRGSTIQFDDVRTERKSLASVDSIDEISISTPSKVKQAAFQLSPGIIRKCKSITESDVLCSNARDRVCFTEESDPENCSFTQLRKRGSTFQFMNSVQSSGCPYEFGDLFAMEENYISCQSINSRDFSDGEEKGNDFSNGILQTSSNMDGRYISTCTNSHIDYETCYNPEANIDKILRSCTTSQMDYKTCSSPEANMDKFLKSCSNSQIDYETCFSPEANMDKFFSYGNHLHEFAHKKNHSFCKMNDEICFDSFNSDITDNLVQSTFHIPSPSYNNRGSTLRENEYRRNCGQDHVSKVRPRRSHSAPPFYKGRNKFSFFYGCSTTKKVTEPDLQSFHRAPNVPVTHFELNELSEVTVTKWRSGDPLPTDGGKSRNLPEQENEILDISSGILHLAGSSLVPDSINKDCLESAKVLPQVDRKFIPVMAGGILAIIDQHAADERIRLEELRRKVLSGEEKTIAYLDSEQELVLPEIGLQLLQNYTEQILDWGWICNIHTRSSGSFTKNMNLLHKQSFTVTLVAVPCILGINLSDKDLLEFLEQLAETDGTSTMPPAVLRVLNFKACRGAIMFGDVLLPSECSLIVEELKATSLCFQCAHGRPTTVPIVNMEALQKQLANLRLQNGGSPEQWHGLRHHKPSLERAKLRLSRFVCN